MNKCRNLPSIMLFFQESLYVYRTKHCSNVGIYSSLQEMDEHRKKPVVEGMAGARTYEGDSGPDGGRPRKGMCEGRS